MCVYVCVQVDHVQLVEELQSQADSLAQQLQAARSQQQQQQDRHAQHGNHGNKQQADHQQALCLKELAAMQQLAALVLQQLQLHLAMQQQGPAAYTCPAGTVSPLLQQQQAATAPACDNQQEQCSLQPPQHHGSSGIGVLPAQCMRLRQLLQQLSEAADTLVQPASAQGGVFQCASRDAAQAGSDCGLDELSLALQDPADSDDLSLSGSDTRAPVSDAIQQLREAMQGPGAVRASSQPQAGAMDVRLHHTLHACGRNSSSSSRQQEPQQLQVVKLRLAYQQVLHKVQARYQQELRHTEVKHQEVGRGAQPLFSAWFYRPCQENCGSSMRPRLVLCADRHLCFLQIGMITLQPSLPQWDSLHCPGLMLLHMHMHRPSRCRP